MNVVNLNKAQHFCSFLEWVKLPWLDVHVQQYQVHPVLVEMWPGRRLWWRKWWVWLWSFYPCSVFNTGVPSRSQGLRAIPIPMSISRLYTVGLGLWWIARLPGRWRWDALRRRETVYWERVQVSDGWELCTSKKCWDTLLFADHTVLNFLIL